MHRPGLPLRGDERPELDQQRGWGQNSRICSWYGVTCADGHVTELSLTENGLAGTLPPAIGGLRGIEFLELGVNQLTGPIPPELGGLPNLIRLVLRENQLTGQIPVNLAFIFGLRVLSLTNNQLTGPIPPELGTLPLFFLSLAGNQLTGEIPLSFGNLLGAQFLWLYGNQLEGTVPVAVAELGGRIQRDHEPDQCRLDSNLTLSMPDTQAYRDSDHDGDGMICGLTLGGSP